MITDIDGILEPALKIGPDWPPAKLEAWANKELSSFGAVAKLEPYKSQGGRQLERILFFLPLQPGPQIAEMYFGDEGEWWVQHYHSPGGKQIAWHVYNLLLAQGIAQTVPDWMEKSLNLNAQAQAQAQAQETPEKKKRRGRPRKQPAANSP